MDAAALYQATLLDRARSPRHAGRLDGCCGSAENRSCGDEVSMSLRVERGLIAEARHQTIGCAICQATADLLAGLVAGHPAEPRRLRTSGFGLLWNEAQSVLAHGRVAVSDRDGEAGTLFDILGGVSEFRSRHRCATLPYQALLAALPKDGTHDGEGPT